MFATVLCAWWAEDFDQLLLSAAAAGGCGQCYIISICRKLNKDLFNVIS